MPFIPHTDDDVAAMLASIGAPSIDALFDEIPDALKAGRLEHVPPALSEYEISRLMHERADADGRWLSFLGAGAYERHIPAAVWQIATRGEFYSAYTPYQAEASQGTLQVLYEYQSMMTSLAALDVTNASLYDGASALAEAVLMAVRANRKGSRRVIVPRAVNPRWRSVVHATVRNQRIELVEAGYDRATGATDVADVERLLAQAPAAALVVPQANFFGVLDEFHALTDLAHRHGALAIGIMDPVGCAVVAPPGEWGETGADIACGEGQPLGVPLSNGGPYFGFLACKQDLVRQMPGRIVGRTVDVDGRPGFTLTLQAREQHIRRSKATSNICTNQGLTVTAATIYMAIVGPDGLARVADASIAQTAKLADALAASPGVSRAFTRPTLFDCALVLDQPVGPVLERLADQRIVGGLDISADYPELGHALLVSATETKLDADVSLYANRLAEILGEGVDTAEAVTPT